MNRKKANCTPKSQSYQRLNRNESSANRSQNSTPTSAKVRARGRIDDSIDLTLASDSGGNSLQSTENLVGTTIKVSFGLMDELKFLSYKYNFHKKAQKSNSQNTEEK